MLCFCLQGFLNLHLPDGESEREHYTVFADKIPVRSFMAGSSFFDFVNITDATAGRSFFFV
ncbi:MAG: hypothetical protein D3914_14045 [Candidatus Electrothrix sp. LOE2]|nr:hypothetical protein [Candidatus Electrothrix sp. LOE2]